MNCLLSYCEECLKEGKNYKVPIVNKKYMLCQKHNRIRLNNQREVPKTYNNRFSQTYEYDTRWGFEKEIDMFEYIWNTRVHISELSGRKIAGRPVNFLHILAKGLNQYPKFRLNPDNIVLGTEYEHFLIDSGNSNLIDKYIKENPQFQIGLEGFKAKKEKLIKEYNKLYSI